MTKQRKKTQEVQKQIKSNTSILESRKKVTQNEKQAIQIVGS
jgi:hypothetical protein